MVKWHCLILFLLFHKSGSCKFNLEKKSDEFEVKYTRLLRIALAGNDADGTLWEKHKLLVEASMFNTFAMGFFASVKINALNVSQKNIFGEKLQKYKGMTNEFSHSVLRNCELWKFCRELVTINLPMTNDNNKNKNTNNTDNDSDEEQLDLNEIECSEMEEMLQKIGENAKGKLDYFPATIREYVRDCRTAHSEAIQMLLKPSEDGRSAKGRQKAVVNYWKLTEFFDEPKTESETEFTHMLRIMGKKCRDEEKCDEILQVKEAIRKLVGPHQFLALECQNPLALSFDIVDDGQIASDYAKMFSKNATEAKPTETVVFLRLCFAKIIETFSRVCRQYHRFTSNAAKGTEKAVPKFFEPFAKVWTLKLAGVFAEISAQNKMALFTLFCVMQRLLSEHNKMPTLKRSEHIGTAFVEDDTDMESVGRAIRAFFYETHAKRMVKLFESGRTTNAKGSNAFSDLLARCQLDDGEGTKFRVRQFYALGEAKNNGAYEQLRSKYPQLGEMLRIELNDEEISKIQSRNYLKFMDANIEEKSEWMPVKFMLNILVYYQCFKRNMGLLPSAQLAQFDAHLAELELYMNCAAEFASVDEIRREEAQMLLRLFQMKSEFFADKIAQNAAGAGAENALCFPMHLHEIAIGELLRESDEFGERLKMIRIDRQRLALIISANSAAYKQLLMESNANFEALQNVGAIDEKNGQENAIGQSKQSEATGGNESEESFDAMLMHFYQRIMADGVTITDELKKQMGIDAMLYHHKAIIFRLISEIEQSLKVHKNHRDGTAKLAELKAKVREWGLFASPPTIDYGEKRRTICLIKIYLQFFVGGDKMREREEEKERKDDVAKGDWGGGREGGAASVLMVLQQMNANFEDWGKIDCDNSQLLAQYFDGILSLTEFIEGLHIDTILRLFRQFPKFAQFVNDNPIALHGIRRTRRSETPCFYAFSAPLDDGQIHNLYKQFFLDDDEETMYECEAIIGLNHLLNNEVKRKEAKVKWEDRAKMAPIRAKLFAMLKIFDIYAENAESLFRMGCPLISYIGFLDDLLAGNAGEALAQMPLECLLKTFGQNMQTFRNFMSLTHLRYLQRVLIENGNDLVPILRDTAGAFRKMEQLIGRDGTKGIWEVQRNRQKLCSQNFFGDKQRLFAHYYNAIAKRGDEPRRTIERLMADLAMICNYLHGIRRMTTNRKLWKEIQTQTEHFWLYLRKSYDEFYLMAKGGQKIDAEALAYASLLQRHFMGGLVEFSDELSKRRNLNAESCSKNWQKTMELASEYAKEQWRKAGKAKLAEPNEMIKKMHFDQLRDMETLKSEKGLSETITTLMEGGIRKSKSVFSQESRAFHQTFGPFYRKNYLTDLRKNKNKSRENLVGLLTAEDRDKIIEQIMKNGGGEFDEENGGENIETKKIGEENLEEILKNNEKKTKKKGTKRNGNRKKKNGDGGKSTDSAMGSQMRSTEDTKNSEDGEEEEEKSEKTNGEKVNDQNQNNNNNNSENESEKQEKQTTINEEILSEELNKFGTFKEFRDELKLYELYKAFIWSPSDEKLLIVEQAGIVFEIKQRIDAIEQLENVSEEKEIKSDTKSMLIKRFEEILENLGKNHAELNEMQNQLVNLLVDTLKYFDEFSPIFYGTEIGAKELKAQIVSKYLAFAIGNCRETEQMWTKSGNRQQQTKRAKVIDSLAMGRQRTAPEIGHHLEGMAIGWRKMLRQIQIDEKMHEQFAEEANEGNFLMPTFPKMSQSVGHFNESFDEKIYDSLKMFLDNFLGQTLRHHSVEEFDQKTLNVINSIHRIVDEWSGKRSARLLLSGSHLLGTHSFDSDIDLICVVPGKSIKQCDFFGSPGTECTANVCRRGDQQQQKTANASLFCALCEHKSVDALVKITYGSVSMLKFAFGGIDVDISFVSVKDRKNLPALLSEETLNKYLNKFYSEQNDKFDKQIRVLSSYCSTLYMKNLLMEGHNEGEKYTKTSLNFRLMIRTLKLWAKNNFIYSNKFGYLNGAILTIMATKVVLLYPNAPIQFLLEKFFLIYSKRETEVPIKLKLDNESSDKKHFDEAKFVREEVMRIYTPSLPEQNAAKLVTHSTARIIRKNMLRALTRIKKFSSGKFDWSMLLGSAEQENFIQMYEFFILINCMSESELGAAKFCQFVESRIRLQLVYDIEQRGRNIETQLYPEIYQERCKMSEKMVKTKFRKNFCKVWLVGLDPGAFLEHVKKELAMFDLAIKRAFLKYNPIGSSEDNGSERKVPSAEEIGETFESLKFDLMSLTISAQQLNGSDEKAKK